MTPARLQIGLLYENVQGATASPLTQSAEDNAENERALFWVRHRRGRGLLSRPMIGAFRVGHPHPFSLCRFFFFFTHSPLRRDCRSAEHGKDGILTGIVLVSIRPLGYHISYSRYVWNVF